MKGLGYKTVRGNCTILNKCFWDTKLPALHSRLLQVPTTIPPEIILNAIKRDPPSPEQC